MALTQSVEILAEALSEAALDAKPVRWQRGTKTQITISLAPELLDRLDEIAARKHINRSAMLSLLIGEAVAREGRAA